MNRDKLAREVERIILNVSHRPSDHGRLTFSYRQMQEAILTALTHPREEPAQDQWRCVNCKHVVLSATEPNYCSMCRHRTFAHIDPSSLNRVSIADETPLRALVAAWDSLPGGYHNHLQIERWLVEKMKPAIDAARAALSSTPIDGEDGR